MMVVVVCVVVVIVCDDLGIGMVVVVFVGMGDVLLCVIEVVLG